ncbi:MAG: 30S ribosomal protein S17 [Candidatus Marinimicrobia bacterium]|nr:30S ribosomal protein S17 [Candidatus Neomarinimicrobiota bacterium]MBL7046361.1 30S ribosomal protein S17 [Candidatus Neomarinimicrobiota bacterium]
MNNRGKRPTMMGMVVSDRMDKTVVVSVERRVQHPIYKKYITRKKKYYVHDEKNECSIGDTVRIISSRPLSKLKRWRVTEIIEKSKGI